jgi:leader peptidase (prepilin peptidase)/N-methyltransferase
MELVFTNFLLIAVGGCLGSFASMLIYRLPRLNESLNIFKPRSFCPQCKTQLSFFQLIPFLGYLASRGKCGDCKNKISPIYLANEIIVTLLIIFFINVMGANNSTVWIVIAIVFILYVQSMMDQETLLLSQPLSLLLLIIGLTLNIWQEFFTIPIDALLGLVFGYGLLFSINLLHRILKNVDGIGSGDFLLLGGIGSTFGASSIGPILLIGSSITLCLYLLKGKKEKELPLGFGLGFGAILYCILFIAISTP